MMNPSTFSPGESAKVRQSIHSPYSGRTGIVLDFDPSDKRGAYLVIFSDGLQFRYKPQELEPLNPTTPPRRPRVFESLFRGLHSR
jgi:hypothetical protein